MEENKHILILHAHNTYNLGAFMMLVNFIHYYAEQAGGDPVFHVELQSEEDLSRLKQMCGQHRDIRRLNVSVTAHGSQHFFSRLRNLHTKLHRHPGLFRQMGIHAIVILGGDDLSEYYKGWQVAADLIRIRRYARHLPVFLVGQTIGPFRGWRRGLARRCLRKVHLWFRDSVSMELYREQGGSGQLHLGADLALPELPDFSETKKTSISGLVAGQYITLVPSGFHQLFCDRLEDYLNCWTGILRYLITHEQLKQDQLLLMPHVTRPEDDRRIMRALLERLDEQERSRIVFIDEELMPDAARTLIGGGRFTLSGRMHACVSSLQQGRPAIPLAYSIKFSGVLGTALGQQELIADASQRQEWENAQVIEKVAACVSRLLAHYSASQTAIIQKVKEQQQTALKQIHDIAAEIQDR